MTTLALDARLDERTLEILERRRRSGGRRRGWLMRRLLLASDMLGLVLAFAAAEAIVPESSYRSALHEALLLTIALPVWVVLAKLSGLYARDEERADHSAADDVVGVFQLITIGTWLVLLTGWLTHIVQPQLSKLALFWLFGVTVVPLLRGGARAACMRSLDHLQNTIILGADAVGQQVARKLLKHPEYGINLVGFVDTGPDEPAEDLVHVAMLGGLEDIGELVDLLDVERVIIAFSGYGSEEVMDTVRLLNQKGLLVDVVPRYFEVLNAAASVHGVEGLPLLGVRPPRLSSSERFLKRSLDLVGALVGLLLLAPLFAVIALAIKLDSRGPVFFRQVRMGTGDRTFRIVKFRTMSADADARKAEIAHLNKHAEGDSRMFKIDGDPRVTRVGRTLRRVSLDELPQLWNVLKGEMSLVGPRPLILDEHAFVTDWAERRLDLRPGVTGLWQVLGRDAIPFGEMIRLDYAYVSGWTFAGDLQLILRTIPVLFGGRRGS